MPVAASYRKKHYVRSEATTTANQAVVIDTLLIPQGVGVVVKNCHFQGTARGLPVAAQAWAVSQVNECDLIREGANGLLGAVAIVTRYIGSGVSLTPAAGTVAATAGGVNFVVTGVPNSEDYTNQVMDWYLEYEVFWAVGDFPE
jgi:hypothetical protein